MFKNNLTLVQRYKIEGFIEIEMKPSKIVRALEKNNLPV